MTIIKINFQVSSALISFLWRPKTFFNQLRESPNIVAPLIMIFLLYSLPYCLYLLFKTETNLTISFIGYIIGIKLIGFIILTLLSWAYTILLYKWMKVETSAKLVLSVLLYGILAVSYYSFFMFLFQQLSTLLVGYNLTVLQLANNTDLNWLVHVAYTGFGLKWAIASSNKHFLIVFITYHLILLFT